MMKWQYIISTQTINTFFLNANKQSTLTATFTIITRSFIIKLLSVVRSAMLGSSGKKMALIIHSMPLWEIKSQNLLHHHQTRQSWMPQLPAGRAQQLKHLKILLSPGYVSWLLVDLFHSSNFMVQSTSENSSSSYSHTCLACESKIMEILCTEDK